MVNRRLLKQIKGLCPGCLIRVEWYDASVGKSRRSSIDVPALSYGLFLGVLGEMNKHIVLCQNSFKFTNGLYDVDYIAVPLDCTVGVAVMKNDEVSKKVVQDLLESFLAGRNRTAKQRISNHGS